MLTLKKLKAMKKGIFAEGFAEDSPAGINMENTGEALHWVAVRGTIHDWAIYCHLTDNSSEYVRDWGNKVHDRETVQKLVPCDKEALAMYRD